MSGTKATVKNKRNNFPIPTEHQEQARYFELVELYRSRYPDLEMVAAVPNAGAGAQRGQAGKMKAEGVQTGYPDILIDCSRHGYHGARIEMKRSDGGAGLSDAQADWFCRLEAQGFKCFMAKGCNSAWAFTCWYLEIII